MRFRFASTRLKRLYEEEFRKQRYSEEVVDAFFDVMGVIDGANDERDLRELKQLHFEKLEGKRKHQRSLALHGGFRLIIQLPEDENGKYVLVEEIKDYH